MTTQASTDKQTRAWVNSAQVGKILSNTAVFIAVIVLTGVALSAISGRSYFNLIQLALNGLLVGGVYSVVALGLVIINKASGIFNFSHGMMMLFGGLMFWQSFNAIPSVEFSAILGLGAFLSLMVIISETLPSQVLAHANENRLQKFIRQASTPSFLLTALVSAGVGAAVFFGLQNLGDDILRGALGGLVGSVALGLIVERFAIRPLIGQPVLASIMMTLAAALVLQGFIALVWGPQPRSLPVFVEPARQEKTVVPIGVNPQTGETIYQEIPGRVVPPQVQPNYVLETDALLGGDLSFARNLVWGFGIAILCFVSFVAFFQLTPTGLAMRAVAENQVLAESVGLKVRTILAVAWAIAVTMATIAAVIQGTGPGVGLSAVVIPPLAFRAFPAVLLGGLESVTGALVGGLVIGVAEVMASALLDSTTGQEFIPFAVLLIVLLIKPDGLFGQRRIDRV
jgi:branched-chain amino acid transport system permease protein